MQIYIQPLVARISDINSQHCKAFPELSESANGQYCIRYIQDFIDGAVATDKQVLINVEVEYARKEAYVERATRTRSECDVVYASLKKHYPCKKATLKEYTQQCLL